MWIGINMAMLLENKADTVPLKDQLAVANRMADLQWQINFTQIKLNRWKQPENLDWAHLKSLNSAAKAELSDLSTVFCSP